MKHLLTYKLFENNIDDILDRMNKGEQISDVELKQRGIDPEKFPKKNLGKTIVKITGDKTPLLDVSTPEYIVHKILDVYYKGCNIVDGIEARENWFCDGDDCKMPESIKWIVAYEPSVHVQKSPSGDKEYDLHTTMFGICHNIENGEKKIYAREYLTVKRNLFPDWEWDDDDGWFDVDYFVVPIGTGKSTYLTFKEEQNYPKVIGNYFLTWVCKKFQLKVNEWTLATHMDGTNRFMSLAENLLGKNPDTRYQSRFKPGKIIGKL